MPTFAERIQAIKNDYDSRLKAYGDRVFPEIDSVGIDQYVLNEYEHRANSLVSDVYEEGVMVLDPDSDDEEPEEIRTLETIVAGAKNERADSLSVRASCEDLRSKTVHAICEAAVGIGGEPDPVALAVYTKVLSVDRQCSSYYDVLKMGKMISSLEEKAQVGPVHDVNDQYVAKLYQKMDQLMVETHPVVAPALSEEATNAIAIINALLGKIQSYKDDKDRSSPTEQAGSSSKGILTQFARKVMGQDSQSKTANIDALVDNLTKLKAQIGRGQFEKPCEKVGDLLDKPTGSPTLDHQKTGLRAIYQKSLDSLAEPKKNAPGM